MLLALALPAAVALADWDQSADTLRRTYRALPFEGEMEVCATREAEVRFTEHNRLGSEVFDLAGRRSSLGDAAGGRLTTRIHELKLEGRSLSSPDRPLVTIESVYGPKGELKSHRRDMAGLDGQVPEDVPAVLWDGLGHLGAPASFPGRQRLRLGDPFPGYLAALAGWITAVHGVLSAPPVLTLESEVLGRAGSKRRDAFLVRYRVIGDGQAEAGRVHLEGQGAVLYDSGTCETLVMDFQGTVQVRGARPSPVFLFHRQVLASAAPAKKR